MDLRLTMDMEDIKLLQDGGMKQMKIIIMVISRSNMPKQYLKRINKNNKK